MTRYARRLVDDADDELFSILVSPDFFEATVEHARNALDRGVAMYLGSEKLPMRALIREHLPAATVWEPQLDWTKPPTYPRIGRFLLADRRRVMLAVLEEPGQSNADERVLVAGGQGLVVLVRELLGSRLDPLEFQTEDVQQRFPT